MRLAVLFALAFTLVACDSGRPSAPVRNGPEAGIEVRFPVAVGRPVVNLRLAVTDLEKARGLMGTAQLPETEGMAFLYERAQRASFWMRDTPLDLDIAFVSAEGVILEVRTMRALDLTSVESKSNDVRLAVEMPAGWFERQRVTAGARVDLEAVRLGLTARGFDPKRYLP
ncbi:MAG: DUF192 domain-containing protein [Verrucomicrobia bacterium]|nr:DUF192 domain-containing protein [Verrucomicrobiota bacterium]